MYLYSGRGKGELWFFLLKIKLPDCLSASKTVFQGEGVEGWRGPAEPQGPALAGLIMKGSPLKAPSLLTKGDFPKIQLPMCKPSAPPQLRLVLEAGSG